MLDAERSRCIVSESFPELAVRSVRFFAQGWGYELWEVNGDLLFRFPQRPEVVETLRKETHLLAELAGTLSVPLPRPEYLSDGCQAFPLPFIGYRKLAGLPLDTITLGEGDRETVAHQLGRFLTELHRFPQARAAGLGVPVYSTEGWRDYYRDFREEVRRDVLPLLSADERPAVGEVWHAFLDDARHFRFEPVLIHADLGLEHILVDQERTQITGVIDFEDAVVGDPALDFAGFDESLRQAVLAGYDLPIDDTLLTRAVYYRKLGPFHQVRYGLQIHDQAHVEDGLARIRNEIVRGE